MKNVIIWVNILVVVGFAMSIYFMPSQEDQMLIDLKMNQYTAAQKYFENQYDQGNRSPDVIITLSKLYEKQGDFKDAIRVVRDYIETNPNNISGLKRLSDLYLLNQQSNEYFQTLLELRQLKKDPEVLEALVDWLDNNEGRQIRGVPTTDLITTQHKLYEGEDLHKDAIQMIRKSLMAPPKTPVIEFDCFCGICTQIERFAEETPQHEISLLEWDQVIIDAIIEQFEIQQLEWDLVVISAIADHLENVNSKNLIISILEELIETGKVDDSYYLRLAYLEATYQQYSQTKTLLKNRRRLFPSAIVLEDLLFEIWIDDQIAKTWGVRSNDLNDDIKMIAEFLMAKNDPKIAQSTLDIINVRNPELVSSLIDQIAPLVNKNQELEIASLQILWQRRGERKKYIPRILAQFKKAPGNLMLQNMVFGIYLEEDDDTAIGELISQISGDNIEEVQIINLAVMAILHHKPSLTQAMQKNLGPAYLERHPVIAVALAIGSQDKGGREQFDQLIKDEQITMTELYYLFKITAAANEKAETMEIGERLYPYIGMADFELIDMTLSYIQLEEADAFYKNIQEALPLIGNENAAIPLVLLDIALHRTERVKRWLNTHPVIPEYVYSSLYIIANQNKEYSLALMIAKRQLEESSSIVAQANYALALVNIGSVDTGIAWLKLLYEHHQDNIYLTKNYFSALSAVAKNDITYRNDLVALMTAIEGRKSLYGQFQKDFAYLYLEFIHNYTKAENIFLELSEDASPTSDNVKTLVYLWGPKINLPKQEWLEKRVLASNREDLGYWLEILNYVRKYETVIDIYEKRSNECLGVVALFAYLNALAYTENKYHLKDMLESILCRTYTQDQMSQLAVLTEEAGYLQGRRWVWEWFVDKHPDMPIYWQKLAKVAIDQNDFTTAAYSVERIFDLISCCRSYNPKILDFFETLYDYGEALRKHRHFHDADRYFALALGFILEVPEPTIRMREIQAILLNRLKVLPDPSLGVMDQLFKITGRDPEIAASYAGMMMDAGKLRSARYFLEKNLHLSSNAPYCVDVKYEN